MSSVQDRIMVITDLLLGAAYADETLQGEEDAAVRRLLAQLLEAEELPTDVDARIRAFPTKEFDLKATADDFASDPPINKRKLLELVAAVRDADEELDLSEDDYLCALGKTLGLEKDEYSDLTLEYEVEELRPKLESLRAVPPPIPED